MGGDTPFRKAIYHGHTECARLLIAKGAECNSASEKHISPLHLGVFKGMCMLNKHFEALGFNS